MADMISACGLLCSECPAYKATREDDDEARKQTAELWSKLYGVEIVAKSINCDGCLAMTGRQFQHCNECDVRKCTIDKGYDNCAACDDFSCDKLEAIFSFAPEAKLQLEKLRNI